MTLTLSLDLGPPGTDTDFLSACARLRDALAALAGHVATWAGGLTAVNPPPGTLAPLGQARQDLTAAAFAAVRAATAFEDEFGQARAAAARGMAITGSESPAPDPPGTAATPPPGARAAPGAAGRPAVERWPIGKVGALRSGNNPEMTVEEEHRMRMAGQGNPHRNDTLRAEAFGFPDARAYQQHITDSVRDRGMVNPVEYREEEKWDYDLDDLAGTGVLTMTTGHHRYSAARILGWTHMDVKRQGPYGSQDKPVPGFEGRR